MSDIRIGDGFQGDPRELNPEIRDDMRRSYVVTMDLGTSGIGIFIKFPQEGNNGAFEYCFSLEGYENTKGPSDVAFPRGGDFSVESAFVGEEAISKAREDPTSYSHFINYKKDICQGEKRTLIDCTSVATNGDFCRTIDIISAVLYKCYDFTVKKIMELNANIKDPRELINHIYYVITHPVLEDNAYIRHFFRTAALRAGVIKRDLYDNHMWFFTEPLSAGYYLYRARLFPTVYPNAKVLVIDCGGGTVDCVTLILGDLTKNTMYVDRFAWGFNYGSANINLKLLDTIAHLVTKGRYGRKIFDPIPGLTAKLNKKVEEFKLALSGANGATAESTNFEFKLSELGDTICQQYGISAENINEFVSAANDFDPLNNPWILSPDNKTLYLSRKYVANCVQHISKIISGSIKQRLEVNHINYQLVALVGGFSSSEILQKEIRKIVRRTSDLVYDMRPILYVVKGGQYYHEFGASDDEQQLDQEGSSRQ